MAQSSEGNKESIPISAPYFISPTARPITLSRSERANFLFPLTPPHAHTRAQGANRALADAVSLADAFVALDAARSNSDDNQSTDAVCRALRLHEASMCARSAVKVRGSRAAVEQTHCAAFIDVDAALRRRGMHDTTVRINRERRERIERMRTAHIRMHSDVVELDRAAYL